MPSASALVSASGEGLDETRHGFFDVMVPLAGEAASVRITDLERKQVFGGFDLCQVPEI